MASKDVSPYSEEQKVNAYIAYRLEGHNAAAAERVTGIPAQTIRKWVKDWNATGFIPGQEAWVEQTVTAFADKATKVRDKALARLGTEIDKAENVGQIVSVIEKLDKTIRLTMGQATSIVEERVIDADQISAALAKYIDDAAQATIERHEIVIDADFEEQVLGITTEDTPEDEALTKE